MDGIERIKHQRTRQSMPVPTGRQTALVKRAQQEGRRSAPIHGGVKRVMRELQLVSWGKKADDIFRLRLYRAAKKIPLHAMERKTELVLMASKGQSICDQFVMLRNFYDDESDISDDEASRRRTERELDTPIFILRQKIKFEGTEELENATSDYNAAKLYIDYEDDYCEELCYTPIRSKLHLQVIQVEGKQALHPWADFLIWYQTYINADYNKVFDENQMIIVNDMYTIQYIYKDTLRPYVIITRYENLMSIYDYKYDIYWNSENPTDEYAMKMRTDLKNHVKMLYKGTLSD